MNKQRYDRLQQYFEVQDHTPVPKLAAELWKEFQAATRRNEELEAYYTEAREEVQRVLKEKMAIARALPSDDELRTALAANRSMKDGEIVYDESYCQCDAAVGMFPCEYCAIHVALQKTFHARILASRKESNMMVEWATTWPTEPGRYWFYGYRYGYVSCGCPEDPVLMSVEVWKAANGVAYVAEGQFMYPKETKEAHFIKAAIPEFPTLKGPESDEEHDS